MEQITPILVALGGLVTLFGLVKTLIELSAISTTRERSQYEFAYSLAQRAADPALTSYALELGYKTLINDVRLSTAQRRALLTLPDRVRSISLYLKARWLLTVQQSGQVLRWTSKWHERRWYRRTLMGMLWSLYGILGWTGFVTFFGPYPKTFSPLLDQVLAMPTYVSISLIFIGTFCLYRATVFSIAEELIAQAETVGPYPQ